MEREDSNITRKALLNEAFMGLKCIGYECKQLTDKLGLTDIMVNLVSKVEIKQAIARDSYTDQKEEMQNIKKVGDRWTANPMDNTYMKYMSLPNSRIWMRYRSRSTTEVKINITNFIMKYKVHTFSFTIYYSCGGTMNLLALLP